MCTIFSEPVTGHSPLFHHILYTRFAICLAVLRHILGIHSATSTLSRVVYLDFSIDDNKFSTDFSWYPSSPSISSRYVASLYILGRSFMYHFSKNNSICRVPSPSIFIATLDTAISICHCIFAGQCIFGQYIATFQSSLHTAVAHTGHRVGTSICTSVPVRTDSITDTISGMTSPARTTYT
jgi:hypothetical protein